MPGMIVPTCTYLSPSCPALDLRITLTFSGDSFSDHLNSLLDPVFQSSANFSLSTIHRDLPYCSQDLGSVHRHLFYASPGILSELPSTPEIFPFWNNLATLLLLTQAFKPSGLLVLPQQQEQKQYTLSPWKNVFKTSLRWVFCHLPQKCSDSN